MYYCLICGQPHHSVYEKGIVLKTGYRYHQDRKYPIGYCAKRALSDGNAANGQKAK